MFQSETVNSIVFSRQKNLSYLRRKLFVSVGLNRFMLQTLLYKIRWEQDKRDRINIRLKAMTLLSIQSITLIHYWCIINTKLLSFAQTTRRIVIFIDYMPL